MRAQVALSAGPYKLQALRSDKHTLLELVTFGNSLHSFWCVWFFFHVCVPSRMCLLLKATNRSGMREGCGHHQWFTAWPWQENLALTVRPLIVMVGDNQWKENEFWDLNTTAHHWRPQLWSHLTDDSLAITALIMLSSQSQLQLYVYILGISILLFSYSIVFTALQSNLWSHHHYEHSPKWKYHHVKK